MRNTFRYIIAILAGVVAFASCAKEMPGTEPAADGKERVITATFGYASKSTLDTDGLTPIFTDGDLITVTNGTATQVCTLRVSGTLSTFTTKLEGSLTAVYPRDAAVLSGNSITGVKVPSIQTGLFKDANIAKAEIAANSLSAHFVNQTAILRFYVDESIEVKHITITGSLAIANEGSNLKEIVVDADDALIHTKTTGNPDPRLCYVAVLPCPVTGTDIITPNDLTFTSVTNTQETVTRTTTAKLKTAGMYNAFIPYYIDMGTAGKWAYCNIGAFLPEEAGRYFAWGDTVGQTWNGSAWSGSGFSTAPGIGNPSTLPSQYDAANVNWGEKWRMPTVGEFTTLISGTGTTKEADVHDGALTIHGTSLYFPASGYGNGNKLDLVGQNGFCWSSSLGSSSSKARYLNYCATQLIQDDNNRYWGFPVRAVYDEGPGVKNDGYEDAGSY